MNRALEERSFRQAGERIRSRLQERLLDAVDLVFLLAASFGSLFGVMIGRHLTGLPLFAVICAMILVASFTVLRLLRLSRSAAPLQNGLHGERLIGDVLDRFKADGAAVFHGLFPAEIPIGDLDHVLIHPNGVFLIETKMVSGRPGDTRAPLIRVEGGHVLEPFVDSCPQARRAAKWLSDSLKDRGWSSFVTPIVVYPGCDIRRTGPTRTHVVNAKGLVKAVRSRAREFNQEQIRAIARIIEEIDENA